MVKFRVGRLDSGDFYVGVKLSTSRQYKYFHIFFSSIDEAMEFAKQYVEREFKDKPHV